MYKADANLNDWSTVGRRYCGPLENGHEGNVKRLLAAKADVNSKDYTERTPLLPRAPLRTGHESIVKLLLAAKADVNSKDYIEQTPLLKAAENGHKGIVKLLLAAKADVNSKDYTGWTPLSWAAENGHKGNRQATTVYATSRHSLDHLPPSSIFPNLLYIDFGQCSRIFFAFESNLILHLQMS